MVMANNNNLRALIPGIFCTGADSMVVNQHDNTVHLHILPEKNSETTVRVHFHQSTIAMQPSHTSTDILKYIIQVDFHHAHASLEMLGLYQLCDQEALDIQTVINHHVPHCTSKQVWKGVLNDASHVLFDAKIIVHPDAQKTCATLSNKNLLLSPAAQVQSKPILEIYADDVKCTHGATVGCLDQQALFYLRSRGIAENVAKEMLVSAFCDRGDLDE